MLEVYFDSWKKLAVSQKLSVVTLLFILLTLPLALFLTLNPIQTMFSRAKFEMSITYPEPTSTPKPTLTSGEPVKQTKRFKEAQVGKKYAARVYAYDKDDNDNLEMKIDPLPPDLYQKRCTFYNNLFKKSYVLCSIEGIPTEAGEYQVFVRVNDDSGGYVEKTIPPVVGGARRTFFDIMTP